jgi:hypothetical protein
MSLLELHEFDKFAAMGRELVGDIPTELEHKRKVLKIKQNKFAAMGRD